jgi:hypothetical protein
MIERISASLPCALLGLLLAGAASALPIEASVGSGPDLATVVLEFEDGAGFVFEVAFDDSIATTGLDLMQVLEAELASFSLVILDFGFGLFIDGISYDGHSNAGFGGGELFWHYWTKDAAADPWTFSQVGAVDRVVPDGAFEGWKYGAGAPIPEPTTGLLVWLGVAALCGLRVRAQSRGVPRSAA